MRWLSKFHVKYGKVIRIIDKKTTVWLQQIGQLGTLAVVLAVVLVFMSAVKSKVYESRMTNHWAPVYAWAERIYVYPESQSYFYKRGGRLVAVYQSYRSVRAEEYASLAMYVGEVGILWSWPVPLLTRLADPEERAILQHLNRTAFLLRQFQASSRDQQTYPELRTFP